VSVLRLGVIVNPIAGMGGAVGLKGTDAPETLREARARGAVPRAAERMAAALAAFVAAGAGSGKIVAAGGDMGEAAARRAGLFPDLVRGGASGETGAIDTARAAAAMAERGAALILFAGGDGTARCVCEAVGERVPALGVPAGVKMHSAVYAATPRAAGDLAARFLGGAVKLRPAEVMDIDEAAYRSGALSARLFGALSVPYDRASVQGLKLGGVNGDPAALAGIASEVARRMRPGRLTVLGPGTTTRAIAARLGVAKTLLGVDAVRDGRLVLADATEADLLAAISPGEADIVVTPLGGQGHFLGRGNQQISPAVLRRAGLGNLVVVATPQKLASLHNATLRVDTGDSDLDHALAGYVRVITGARQEAVCPVAA
jgi:predicted polyphosphate/ATP-dependent NAD kinase